MLKKLYLHFLQLKAKKRYSRYSVFGSDISFYPCARCHNTGHKENIQIGNHCTIGCAISSQFGGKVTIGNNVYIGGSTHIHCKENISIADNVIIANNTMIIDNNHHPTAPEMRMKMSQCNDFLSDPLWSWEYAKSAPITIEENVWIGRDVRIMKGVTVGHGSIVALGSIVTHDVPPFTIVAGNPAKIVKQLPNPEK